MKYEQDLVQHCCRLEDGGREPKAEGMWELLEAGRSKERDSSLEPLERDTGQPKPLSQPGETHLNLLNSSDKPVILNCCICVSFVTAAKRNKYFISLMRQVQVVVVVQSLTCVQLLQPHGLQPTRLLSAGIFQARVLEWVAIPFSSRSSRPRDRTQVSCIAGRFFTN